MDSPPPTARISTPDQYNWLSVLRRVYYEVVIYVETAVLAVSMKNHLTSELLKFKSRDENGCSSMSWKFFLFLSVALCMLM